MEIKSVKSNFFYNTILKLLGIIFPLITFPYVARILSADGIGKVDFSLSVIQYFIMLAQVGIPMYAVRECSKYRKDKDKLAKTVQEILIINLIMVVISYIILFFIVFRIAAFQRYSELLLIMSISIVATSIGIEWFYQAIEEYKYITIRGIIVRVISLILVVILIKRENDYVIYGAITTLSMSAGYIFNFFHVRKHIPIFKVFHDYNFKKHIKPILILFAMSLAVSVYVNLDKVMLGLISGDDAVGFYSAANRFIKTIIVLVTSLGAVLLPRMSYYVTNGMKIEIDTLIKKAIDFTLLIAIPSTVGMFILADNIIILFAGNGYVDSIITMRILSPITIAIALSNLIGVQILISHGKEKLTLISTIIGAVVNFSLNLLLIPQFSQNGAALGTLIAEITVTVIQIIFAASYIKYNVNFKNILSYMMGSVLIVLVSVYIKYSINSISAETTLAIIISVIVYFGFLYIIKNQIVFDNSNKLFKLFIEKLNEIRRNNGK